MFVNDSCICCFSYHTECKYTADQGDGFIDAIHRRGCDFVIAAALYRCPEFHELQAVSHSTLPRVNSAHTRFAHTRLKTFSTFSQLSIYFYITNFCHSMVFFGGGEKTIDREAWPTPTNCIHHNYNKWYSPEEAAVQLSLWLSNNYPPTPRPRRMFLLRVISG